jgi:membrane associated rhomboid family serine protease
MGVYDRDYFRSEPQRGGFAGAGAMSITTWLIVINVVVFLLDGVLLRMGFADEGPLTEWGAFTVTAAIAHGQVWRFITFQVLHASGSHLLGNMLALYLFGPIVEGIYGARKFLAMYLICGVAGTIGYLALWGAGMFPGGPDTPLVGASAGIFGLLVVAAIIAPSVTVMFIFPPVPMQLRTMAWIMLGIAVYTVFFTGNNAGGEAAHLGGAAMGFVFAWNPQLLNFVAANPRGRRGTRLGDWRNDPNH